VRTRESTEHQKSGRKHRGEMRERWRSEGTGRGKVWKRKSGKKTAPTAQAGTAAGHKAAGVIPESGREYGGGMGQVAPRASSGSRSRGFVESAKRSRRDVLRGPGAGGTKAWRQLINYCKNKNGEKRGESRRSCFPIIFPNRKSVLARAQIAPWEALSLPNCS